jgi:hypothetical protein
MRREAAILGGKKMGNGKMTYAGWSNALTWMVHRHLTYSKDGSADLFSRVRDEIDQSTLDRKDSAPALRKEAADRLAGWLEHRMTELVPYPHEETFEGITGFALRYVNWRELAEYYLGWLGVTVQANETDVIKPLISNHTEVATPQADDSSTKS